jgi:hypothetical protein
MWQRLKTDFKEQIWDNEQVLKLRQRFAELDPQIQSYVLIGSFSAFVLFLLVTFFTLWGRAISVKSQLALMDDNIRYVQSSAARIEELRSQARIGGREPLLEGLDPAAPAAAFLERATQRSLISKSNVEVTEGRGTSAEVKLSRISLTQLVRMLYIIEHSGAGASVESLNVDARDDREGYLWATISVQKPGAAR